MSIAPTTYACWRSLDCETKDDVEPGPSGWTVAICLAAGPPAGGGDWILCAEAVVGAGSILPCLWCRVGDYTSPAYPFTMEPPPEAGYTVHDIARVTGCTDAQCYNPDGPPYWHSDTCTCAYCPRGYVYNYVTDLCDPTEVYCPPGQCWCEFLGSCISCTPPPCMEQLECVWLPASCGWACELPECPIGFEWNEESCSCGVGDCEPWEGWCEVLGECLTLTDPPCRFERGCAWNSEWCAWFCDTPDCPEGQAWNDATCSCTPACPDGEQWCATSESCVSAPDPACLVELNCVWNATSCEWECDAPPCADWDWEHCECPGAGSNPWCMHTRPGWYHIAYAATSGAIRYRRSSRVYGPPWTVDVVATAPGEDQIDRAPRMILDRRGAVRLLFTRTGGDVWLTQSHDDGATWSEPVELFTGAARPTLNVHPLSRRILYAALRAEGESGGVLVGRQQGSGENEPGEEFTLQLWDADTETFADFTVDTDTFHVSPAPEAPDRWLLVCVREGNIVNFYSPDDGLTWRPVPTPA